MKLRPRTRKLLLTAHVVTSVGWLGAVAAFLALGGAALAVEDVERVRAIYVASDVVVWSSLVPLAVASLVSGLLQAFGTHWGLMRHYWVLTKAVLTVPATIILLLYTQTVGHLAAEATDPSVPVADLHELGKSPVLHAGLALLVLLTTTTLGVVKPRGLTRYGRRKRREERAAVRVA